MRVGLGRLIGGVRGMGEWFLRWILFLAFLELQSGNARIRFPDD